MTPTHTITATPMLTMFDYDFMRNAFYACTIVGIVAGAVGYFLVLRGETFAGHALAHVGFPGATGAGLVGVSPFFGLTTFTVLAGIGIGLLGERAQRDVAIGIVLSFALGLGLLFLHFYTAFAGQTTNILFGNVLGIDLATVRLLAVLGIALLLILLFIARPLLFASLQPELAEAKGVNLDLVSVLFMIVVALATAEATQIVGVLLVFALMVTPERVPDARRIGHALRRRAVRSSCPGDGLDRSCARLLDGLADEFLDHRSRRCFLSAERFESGKMAACRGMT